MTQEKYLVELVQSALNGFNNPQVTLSTTVRQALRVARLRRDYVGVWWLTKEMAGAGNREAAQRLLPELAPHFTESDWKTTYSWVVESFISERSLRPFNQDGSYEAEETVEGKSIPEVEEDVRQLSDFARTLESSQEPGAMSSYDWARITITQLRSVLSKISHRVHEYLSRAEAQLLFGQTNSDVFEQNRGFVDEELARLVPKALDQLKAALLRLREGEAESRSQAVTSCRRALKSLADALYPPRTSPVEGLDGIAHDVSEEKYVNRLWQFVADRVRGHAAGELVRAQVHDLGRRIETLNDLASKGVHAEIPEYEANQCVIETYSVAGDILRLAGRTSAIESAGDGTDLL